MSIHTIGDSHCQYGWRETGVKTHPMGPRLCYSFGKEILNKEGFGNIDIRRCGNIKDGDTIIFCLGEIDCRCHIHKHITNTKPYQDIINNIVDNYFHAIESAVLISKIKFKNICVYNIVPPVQKYNIRENPSYPHLGTDEDRKKYVLYFNTKLKEKCLEYNYIFFDVYNHYIDENGFLRRDLSDGAVHIGNNTYINKFMKENNI